MIAVLINFIILISASLYSQPPKYKKCSCALTLPPFQNCMSTFITSRQLAGGIPDWIFNGVSLLVRVQRALCQRLKLRDAVAAAALCNYIVHKCRVQFSAATGFFFVYRSACERVFFTW